MATILPDDKKWANAFARYGFDAAVGRLFRGIIHNLNGVGQAFLMQTELLNMMFRQADKALDEIGRAASIEEAHEKTVKLRKMLQGRADLAKYLSHEIDILQQTMQRTTLVTEEIGGQTSASSYALGSVIDMELEFLNSDGFFKHKIKKNIELADNLPELSGHRIELHQIIAVLLENASQTLAENVSESGMPEVTIKAAVVGDYLEISVCDNGSGVDGSDLENIFAPFYTTGEGRLGLGLYLARTLAKNFDGGLCCESMPGRTCFILRMPVNGGAD